MFSSLAVLNDSKHPYAYFQHKKQQLQIYLHWILLLFETIPAVVVVSFLNMQITLCPLVLMDFSNTEAVCFTVHQVYTATTIQYPPWKNS